MRDKVLVIDDEPNLRKILEATLSRGGYEVFAFESFESAKPFLETEAIDVVITDLQMPGASGMDVLTYCRQFAPDVPVIMITAFGTVEKAVAAMQSGAFDFILKPFQTDEMLRILTKAIQSRIRRKREPAAEAWNPVGIGPVPLPLFGKTDESIQFKKEVERMSRSGGSIVMLGEVGTGKRSVAQEIHRKSERARGPFIQLNCEAIPPVFQIAELFGVEKGSSPLHFFSKPGTLELSQGGTVFLEEVDALSVEAQNLLFSSLENEFFTRFGGVKQFLTDFRLITTSSHDLGKRVKDGTFHVELYYLLTTETLTFRPLRERRADLESDFVPYFIERACRKRGIPVLGCPDSVLQFLSEQEWPGNLGELERKITQAVNRCDAETLELKHFK